MNNQEIQNQNFQVEIQAETLYSFISALVNVSNKPKLDEANLVFSKQEGLSAKSMDQSSIAMVSASIAPSHFIRYNIEEKEISIGINIFNFLNMLPKKNAIIQISKKNSSKIDILIKGNAQSESLELPIISVRAQPDKEPKIEFTAIMEIETSIIKDIIKKATKLSSHITIKAQQTGTTFHAKGDGGMLDSTLDRAKFEPNTYSITGSKPIEATFNLSFLKAMLTTAPKKGIICLSLKDSDPIRITYNTGTVNVLYFLAPFMTE